MILAGFDPGISTTGWAIINSSETYIASGSIKKTKLDNLESMLYKIYKSALDLLDLYNPNIVCIETQFARKNIKSFEVLVQAKTSIILAAKTAGVEVYYINPKTAKKNISGNGNADKSSVRAMVMAQIQSIPGTISDQNIIDALCIAVSSSRIISGSYINYDN